MAGIHPRRYPSRVSEVESPVIDQSRWESRCNTSERLNHQYSKFMVGSRWKNFILPEFVKDEFQNQDQESVSSKGTFSRVSRVEESRTRIYTNIEGVHFPQTLDPKILRARNASRDNTKENMYPQVSSFSLKKNRVGNKVWSNVESQSDRLQKESFSSIYKPSSMDIEQEVCSTGIQTDLEKPQLTQQQIESLQEQVDYLRRFVYNSFQDCFKKNKSSVQTPKKPIAS